MDEHTDTRKRLLRLAAQNLERHACGARTPSDRNAGALTRDVRDSPVARRRVLGRHRRSPCGSGRRGRRRAPRRVRDSWSDTQRATDLIESEFAEEQGGVLNVVFAAPEGEQLDTPERREAIEQAMARLESDEFAPTEDTAGWRASATRSARTRSPTTAASPTPRRSSTGSSSRRRAGGRRSAGRRPRGRRARRRDRRVQRRRRVPARRAGNLEALGFLAAIIVLLIVFRTFTAMLIPIGLAPTASRRRSCSCTLAGSADRRQHDHPYPRLDDRIGVGVDYLLFIVTRFRQFDDGLSPRDAASEAEPGGSGRALRGPDGGHLGDRPGLLRARLRDQARHRQRLGVLTTAVIANSPCRARALGHKIDRLKVPFLRRVTTRRPRERFSIARWGRFVTAHAKIVFPVVLVVIIGLASTSLLVRSGPPTRGRSRRSRRAAGRTTCSPMVSGQASTGRS